MYSSRIIHGIALLALFFLLPGCANIVPPEGGKKDETPPVLLSIEPADSSLNIRPSKIVLHFNEYMDVSDLEKNLSLSPLLQINPTVLSYGKRVEIKIQDTQLLANTTYRIGLGNALVDNHEANPYGNFVYMFSTGSYFDSLELKGRVIDAATGTADTAALITLYAATDNDTAVLRKKPLYAVRADGSGNFSFRALPRKEFRMYALQDANTNYLYDYGTEKIGFINTTVIPELGSDSLYSFYMFKEIVDSTGLKSVDTAETVDRSNKPDLSAGKRNKGGSNKIGYRVNVDTNDIAQRSFELTNNLAIDLYTELKSLDTAKVYLSYENNGIEVEAVQKLRVDTVGIKIHTQWQPDKKYTLRLVKGWAKDTAGAELPPGKYFFRTKREEDYGKLKVHINRKYFGDSFLLYIYKDKDTDSLYLKSVTDSTVSLDLLQPGNYNMRMIVDDNRNGKWDPGNLFKKIQPETVLPYNTTTVIKAGWENEIDFNPDEQKKTTKPRIDQQPGTRPGVSKPPGEQK